LRQKHYATSRNHSYLWKLGLKGFWLAQDLFSRYRRRMLKLQFYRENQACFSFQLEKDLVRLGRDQDCDLQLQDPFISRLHCVLRNRENRWSLEACSPNGIFVGKDRIPNSCTPLEASTRYRLSRLYSFECLDTKAPPKISRTVLTGKQNTQVLVLEAINEKLRLGQAVIRDAKGFERFISQSSFAIGCHPSNDLVIADETISQFHARIDLSHNTFMLTDLGSTNGCYIDGTKVLRAPLKGEHRIRFGKTEISFRIQEENRKIEDKRQNNFFGLQSKTTKMRKIFSLAEAVAPTEAPVFIQGETGTGKELLAKAIHALSNRSESAFLAINCASLPKELIESELFGHERGAFTGALEAREGAFEAAHLGSLFLDEIGELDLLVQAKLLRALETGEIKRLGSNHSIQTSVRIISATHKNLKQMVQEGKFREDLYYRLHIVPIELPPLRERLEDLEILCQNLFKRLRLNFQLDQEALDSLSDYPFPGNVRELKNILQRAAINYRFENPLANKEEIISLKPENLKFIQDAPALTDSKALAEKRRLQEALEKNHFNQSLTAKELGMAISTLHDRLRRLGVTKKRHQNY